MLGLIQFSPKVGVRGGEPERFAYPGILEINKAEWAMHFKCGHHGQALWAASILGIHIQQSLQCTRLKLAHILLFTLNPQFWNIGEMIDILANPVVDGRVSPSCWEGGVQSAEPDRGCFAATCTPTLLLRLHLLALTFLHFPRALPHCVFLRLHSAQLH